MTTLYSIEQNHLSVECKCGHVALIPVSEIAEVFGNIEVDAVQRALRCRRCKSKGMAKVMIIYVGGSGEALWGTGTQPEKPQG
jgi:DNA-directed RNA polymerase subunit RPC12/RpoP